MDDRPVTRDDGMQFRCAVMLAATAALIAVSGLQVPAVRDALTHRVLEPVQRAFGTLEPVRLTVVDADTGLQVPARVTITDAVGRRVLIHSAEEADTTGRIGVLSTSNGELSFELSRGEYVAYASSGVESSVVRTILSIGRGTNEAQLAIRREVDTTGFAAGDAHVPTHTASGQAEASAPP